MNQSTTTHPLKTKAKILLSSVFGPYAVDDSYGSRSINPMELYHNQVTRVQGIFSLRMFHRSFGLMMIQANLDAPCTLLDFPKLEDFEHELKSHSYDIVGIGAIACNVGKVKKMCQMIRKYQPQAQIVIGGHIASMEDLGEKVDADHIVRGDGIRWFRKYLGQDENAPIRHPMVYSAFRTRILGHELKEKPGDTAAMLIPSVGCPIGCNFCSTSALFGGKGNFINFYETGKELFSIMCRMESTLKVQSFFIMDENFLLHRKRALELLDLMKAHNKSWSLMVFSSARVIQSYTMEQLAGLGISWIWMGLEGKKSQYRKLNDVDTHQLIRTLQSYGIRVLGSTIIGLENHTPDTIDEVIDYAVSHQTDFHQFMLYTPVPGTPLHRRMKQEGKLFPESRFPMADIHGQYRFNYAHPHITGGQEEQFIIEAFKKDFNVNGPSLARLIRTMLNGWQRLKNHPDQRIRNRIKREIAPLRDLYASAVWAMAKWYRKDPIIAAKLKSLLKDLYAEFGIKTRLNASLMGPAIWVKMKREQHRLESGMTLEPDLIREMNPAAAALEAMPVKNTKSASNAVEWAVPEPAHIIG